MKRILCPTDFSKAGDNAIAYAAKLCRQLGGSLTLLHVHALGDLTPGEALWGQAQTLAQAQEALEKKCTEVKTAFKIQCAPYVIHTVVDVNAGIVEEAIPFDLLVMGTAAQHSRLQQWTGTHAYRVQRESFTSVIVVPETVNYSEIKTIVFAFDYFNHDTVPLQWLMQFSKALDCRITILLGVGQPYSHELEEAVREKQRPILSLYQDNDRIDFITLFGENMVDLIDNYTDCYPPDLLAFCAEPRTMMENLFHTSLIKAVGKEATFPMLVVNPVHGQHPAKNTISGT